MPAKVKLNRAGVRALLRDPALTADVAGRVLTAAQATAPVESGAYRESLHSWVEDRGDRVVTRVGSDLPYAAVINANRGHLARALDAGGG